MKFKVGQMVKAKGDLWFNKGELLKIVELDEPYEVYRCKGAYGTWWQDESNLEPIGVTLDGLKEYLEYTEDFKGNKQEEHMKITIETDGYYKTTAECNGVITESLCNPTDEFKLPKGVHMAVQRLLEKLEEPEENTCFHVGDIVEVVDADGYKFFDKVKGIQGIIVSHYNKYVCEVKFPFVVSKKDTWHYHTRALKLVRRGNN